MSASPLPQIPPVTKELLDSLERRFRGMSKATVDAHLAWSARVRAEHGIAVADAAAQRRAMTEDEIARNLVGDAMTTAEVMSFLRDCGFVRIEGP